jgi:hypothetical protein
MRGKCASACTFTIVASRLLPELIVVLTGAHILAKEALIPTRYILELHCALHIDILCNVAMSKLMKPQNALQRHYFVWNNYDLENGTISGIYLQTF